MKAAETLRYPQPDTAPQPEKPKVFAAHEAAYRQIAIILGRTKELPTVRLTELGDIAPEPGVYLTEQVEAAEVTSMQMELDRVALSGKGDSAHKVITGRLAVNAKNHQRQIIEAAAKNYSKRTFDENFDRVQSEVSISQQQIRDGEIGYSLVGVIIAPSAYRGNQTNPDDHDILLITKLDRRATTLDNIAWQLGYNEGNLLAAEAAVGALARFNTRIGVHRDAQLKNIVQLPTGKTSMIDFETSERLDVTDPVSAATACQDFEELLESMAARRFFARQPDRAPEVINRLGDIYLQEWAGYGEHIQSVVIEEIASIIDAMCSSGAVAASGYSK